MKKMESFKKQISKNIRARRIELKIKQKFVASELGILENGVSRIESGNYYISVQTLKALCPILKCKSSDLLGF
jgi:transcriptional regulator with XRE-family HTH domain